MESASMAETLEKLNLSNDEVQRFTDAFKNEEFRKLFQEYADEISDPENRKRYEEEIQMLENERGMNVEFVHPEPGFVIKTSSNDGKVFVNICKNPRVEKPSSTKKLGPNGNYGLQWSIPHLFTPPRQDLDKNKDKCQVYDFVIHPDTYRMTETNKRFLQLIQDTAFDGIEKQFGVNLDRKNVKFPKMQFKGTPSASVIRTKQDDKTEPVSQEESAEKIIEKIVGDAKSKAEEALKSTEQPQQNGHITPKYVIKHQSEINFQNYTNARDSTPDTRPKALVIEIDLPLISSASDVDLDIFEKSLSVESDKYKLNIDLPYEVDENEGSAKFDKTKNKLIITLPVKKKVSIEVISGDEISQ